MAHKHPISESLGMLVKKADSSTDVCYGFCGWGLGIAIFFSNFTIHSMFTQDLETIFSPAGRHLLKRTQSIILLEHNLAVYCIFLC